ncbi:MAG: prenyltransferase [Spirochaetota bacterium]
MSELARMSPWKTWFQSLRPFSFPASVMPVGVAAAVSYAMYAGGEIARPLWIALPFYAIAGVLFHAGTNVLNDYYDYLHGVDTEEDIDPTHLVPRGIVSARFMLVTGHLYFGAGILMGTVIGVWRGPIFVIAGIAAATAAYFYTGARFSFKYVALGDPIVFLLMGPVMIAMGVWALTGTLAGEAVAVSIPLAFLVTAILHGNNLRDIESDKQQGVLTIAGLLGRTASRHVLAALLLAPFAATAGIVAYGIVHPIAYITFPALIPVAYLLRTVYSARDSAALAGLPISCAKVHLVYSTLFIVALLLEGYLFPI